MAARHCFAIFVASLLIVSGGCDATKVADNTDTGGTAASTSSAGEPASAAADFPELSVTPTGNVGTTVGDTAPDIEGTDVDGKAFKLSEYRGKVVMLDFWGDW